MGRMMLAGAAALALGTLAGATPAAAQYGGYGGGGYGGGYGGGGGGYRDRGGYEDYGPRRRRFDDEYDRPPPRFGRRGSVCVTARGNCRYPPAPFNTPCSCDIPGFGEKRGAIGG